MAAHIDEKSDDSWEFAESYVDLFPPKRSKLFAKSLTYLGKLSLVHYFKVFAICWEPIVVTWWILSPGGACVGLQGVEVQVTRIFVLLLHYLFIYKLHSR